VTVSHFFYLSSSRCQHHVFIFFFIVKNELTSAARRTSVLNGRTVVAQLAMTRTVGELSRGLNVAICRLAFYFALAKRTQTVDATRDLQCRSRIF